MSVQLNKSRWSTVTSLSFCIGMSGPVLAGDTRLEEITVTALKRSTSLQDTALSISAFSGSQLEAQGTDDFLDLQSTVAGLNLVDRGPGRRRLVLRGLQGAGEAQVGLYYDEIPISGGPGLNGDSGRNQSEIKLFDIERIEVLRGPQGTLYGSGSMGGTVRVITAKPDPTGFSGKVRFNLESYHHGGYGRSGDLVLNIPLVQDKLAVRGVINRRDNDGWIDNITLGNDDVNEEETLGGRLAMQWLVGDELTISGSAWYQDTEIAAGSSTSPQAGGDGLNVINPTVDFVDAVDKIYNMTIEWSNDNFDLLYSLSKIERKIQDNQPGQYFGFLDAQIFINAPQDTTVDSQELRLSSNGDGLWGWTVGAFYQERESEVSSNILVVDPATGVVAPPPNMVFNRIAGTNMKQKAIFGELSYELTEKLTLTAGLRFFDVERGLGNRVTVGFPFNVIPPENQVVATGTFDERDVIGRFNISYDVSDSLLVYAQYGEGFRAGGPNQLTPGEDMSADFDADTVTNYEIGFNSEWLDGNLVLNAAFYHLVWEDIQTENVTSSGLFRFTANAGEAEINGLEADLSAQFGDISVVGGLAWIDATLSDDEPLLTDGTGYGRTGLSGDEIPSVPEFTANLLVEYGREISPGILGFIRNDVRYVGSSNNKFRPTLLDATGKDSGIIDPQFVVHDSYVLWNLRVGLEGDGWDATFFIDNVADKRAVTYAFVSGFIAPPGQVYVEQPRTIGLTLSKSF